MQSIFACHIAFYVKMYYDCKNYIWLATIIQILSYYAGMPYTKSLYHIPVKGIGTFADSPYSCEPICRFADFLYHCKRVCRFADSPYHCEWVCRFADFPYHCERVGRFADSPYHYVRVCTFAVTYHITLSRLHIRSTTPHHTELAAFPTHLILLHWQA